MSTRSIPASRFRTHAAFPGTAFAEGAAIAQAGTIAVAVAVGSSSRCRFRFKASVAGTLSATFLRPSEGNKFEDGLFGGDAARLCESGNPDDVAVVADTEAVMEFDVYGESWVLFQFTEENVAAGTVTHANVAQV